MTTAVPVATATDLAAAKPAAAEIAKKKLTSPRATPTAR